MSRRPNNEQPNNQPEAIADEPLSIGEWQERMPHHHRVPLFIAGGLILAVLGTASVKSYEYLTEETDTPPSSTPSSTASVESKQLTQAECIAKLPLAQKLGQKLMIGATADTLTQASNTAAKHDVGGVILMKPVPTSVAVGDFTDAQNIPPLVATDQEGGTVQRYTAGDLLPAAASVPDMDLTQLAARIKQNDQYLRSQGVNMNLAPVVDVAPVSGTSVLGSRIFSQDPAVVARDALVYVRAGLATGVLPTIKHFPGLGSASQNTDYGQATTPDFAQLQQRDLIPYQELAGINLAVMVGNQTVPGLTGGLPASLSRAAVTTELRNGLGYQNNVVITDSLSAAAITNQYSIAEASVKAWEAGNDIALFVLPQSGLTIQQQVRRIVTAGQAAIQNGELSEADVNASVERIFALPQKHVDACTLVANE
jgi:beta-N-acetylhexosaminidase